MALDMGIVSWAGKLSDEAALLARRVQGSVVAVRGSRFGGGSGVVWNDQGLVVTNHHVVPSDRADVATGNDAGLPARVVLRDERLDLAALQIERASHQDSWTPATIGDSSRLRVGELVVAVGNPLGERNAVTLGIISAIDPSEGPAGQRELVRAAITLRPGNSGGALADVQGKVVGIPNMVAGPGLALAVPSQVVERFLLGARAERAVLGLVGRWVRLPAWITARYGVSAPAMLVASVAPSSPAERAGLLMGDLLLGVADEAGRSARSLAALDRLRPGKPTRLAVLRSGQLRWLEATPRAA